MTPLFSVIVINFNYARYLGAAIDSALAQAGVAAGAGAQDAMAVEVIVVDDCSTDGSRALIESYGTRIVARFHARNAGMSASANTGFAAARGTRVLFLDADDYLLPGALAAFAAAMRPGVVQVQARLQLIDADGRVEDIFPPPETPFTSGDVTPDLVRRGRYQTTVTSGLAFDRAALERVMPIPEVAFDRSADGYLATVVPLYGAVASIETPLGAYRRHAANHSGFASNIATRARWRVEHDEHRYAALRDHGARTGITIAAVPGLGDPAHLEERLASLTFDAPAHPYPRDSRARLGLHGVRATLAADQKLKRKVVHMLIFAGAGFAPIPVARRLLAWKMERASRPQFIDTLSGWLRRRLA